MTLKEMSDCSYGYSERASLSVLAGAIWKCNKLVLEEFPCSKGRGSNRKRGRADIWFTCGNDQIIAEAKKEWPSVNSLIKNGYSEYCTEALSDAKKTKCGDKFSIPIGLTFIAPYYTIKKDSVQKEVKRKLNAIIDDSKLAFLAKFQPDFDFIWKCRIPPKIYPEVMLIGKFL